jgi:hypothetical protein
LVRLQDRNHRACSCIRIKRIWIKVTNFGA